MPRKLAIVFEGKLGGQRGVLNAVVERAKHLRSETGLLPDVYMIEGYDSGLNRLLHRTPRLSERPERVVIDTVEIRMRWFRHSLADSVRHKWLGRPAATYLRWLAALADELADYAVVSAHDRIAGTAAAMASKKYAMPHFITWHGASIYTDPPRDPVYRAATINLLRQATMNIFVSRGLEQMARRTLTPDFRSTVLYNGASEAFCRFSESERRSLRRQRGIEADERVVGFIGRLEPVKNALLLPEIFSAIASRHHGRLRFVVAGTGSLETPLRHALEAAHVPCQMLGHVEREHMPRLMNCIDVMVVPSRLEGFGLVAAEGIRCGANVVGSNAVGLPEVIGADNAFPLDDRFVDNLADRAAKMLATNVPQTMPPEISWHTTARGEYELYQPYLNP